MPVKVKATTVKVKALPAVAKSGRLKWKVSRLCQ